MSNWVTSLIRHVPTGLWLILLGSGCLGVSLPSMGICGPTSEFGGLLFFVGGFLLVTGVVLFASWGMVRAMAWGQRFFQ